jgi:hypothetical protein
MVATTRNTIADARRLHNVITTYCPKKTAEKTAKKTAVKIAKEISKEIAKEIAGKTAKETVKETVKKAVRRNVTENAKQNCPGNDTKNRCEYRSAAGVSAGFVNGWTFVRRPQLPQCLAEFRAAIPRFRPRRITGSDSEKEILQTGYTPNILVYRALISSLCACTAAGSALSNFKFASGICSPFSFTCA